MRKWSRPKVTNNVGCLGMDVGGGVAEGQTHFPEQRQEGFQGWPILLNKHDRKININSSKKSPGHKINITSSSCWSKIQYFFYMGKCKSYYFPSSISTIWIWSKAAPCNNKSSSLDFDKMWSSFPPTHPWQIWIWRWSLQRQIFVFAPTFQSYVGSSQHCSRVFNYQYWHYLLLNILMELCVDALTIHPFWNNHPLPPHTSTQLTFDESPLVWP